MSKPSRRMGHCAFCGQYGHLSREDFTPKWIARFIEKHMPPENRWELLTISTDGRGASSHATGWKCKRGETHRRLSLVQQRLDVWS